MVKVHVTLHDDVVAGESLWAEVVTTGSDLRYKLASVPFFATELALGDIVDADPDPQWGLEWVRVAEHSDQVTVGVLFDPAALAAGALDPEVADVLERWDVARERAAGTHFSLSVCAARLDELLDRLDQWSAVGLVECHSLQEHRR